MSIFMRIVLGISLVVIFFALVFSSMAESGAVVPYYPECFKDGGYIVKGVCVGVDK